jgi:hypothetical protein
MADLRVKDCREALAICPPGHPNRSSFLNNLANSIDTRYKQSGRMEDLEEMITYHREALTLCHPGHRNRPSSLNNLALQFILAISSWVGRMISKK